MRRTKPPASAHNHPRAFRPQVEALEERAVPSGIALVQQLGTGATPAGVSSLTITVPAAGVETRDTIIVEVAALSSGTPTSATVTDTAGNAYALDADVVNTLTGTLHVQVFSAPVRQALTAGGSIVVTWPGPPAALPLGLASAADFAGLLTASAADRTHTGSGALTPPTSGAALPTTQANELLLGTIGVAGAAAAGGVAPAAAVFTPDPNYTAFGDATTAVNPRRLDLRPEFRVVAAPGVYEAGGKLGDIRLWAATLVTYRPAAPAPLTARTVTRVVPANSLNNVVDVLAGVSDPVGGALVVTSVGAARHGVATVAAGGKSVLYTPKGNFAGTDSFTYTVAGGNGRFVTGTVTITVTPRAHLAVSAPKAVRGHHGVVSFRASHLTVQEPNPRARLKLTVRTTAGKLQIAIAGVLLPAVRTLTVSGTAAALTRALGTLTARLGHAGTEATLTLTVAQGKHTAHATIHVQG